MPFPTLLSLFLLPLASLSIVYASSHPRLLSLQAPYTLSAYHPHNVSVTLSHPLRNPRLHISASPPLTLSPSSTPIINATTTILTFRIPPLPISAPQWRIAALYNNATIVLQLPSNTVFRIIPPPSIASAHPSVLHPARLATVILTGVFPPNPRVFVHSQPVFPPRLLHVSPTEIVLRVRPLRNQTQLSFLVRAPDGLNSTLFPVTVAPDLIPLSAAPLHASYNYPTARYTLPSLCTNFTPLVSFEAHTLQQLQPPLYNVSYRLSTMPPALFRPLQTLVNSTMVLLPEALFSPKHNPHHMVTVLIAVAHAGRTGQTVLFMARRSSPHVFGISVFPHIHDQNPLQDAAVLDASLSPLSCTATPNTTIRMVWRVNNTIVQPLSNASAALDSVATPVTTGLGNRLIVPVHGRFVYVVHAVLLHRSTNRVVARAIATGSSTVTRKALPFKAVLNGAASTVTLPSGTTTYPIRAHVYDQSQYGALSPSQRRFQYEWSCISVFDGAESPCTPQLFSPWLLGERTDVSNFQISTVGVEAGTRVVYTMYVWSDGMRSQRLSFTVLVVNESGVQVFPIEAKLRTASTSFVRSILTDGPLFFKCFESVFVSWNQTLTDPLDFKLFRQDEPRDYLASASEDLLIVHSGYWAKDNPYGRFFAISVSALSPGRYTLYGAVNTTAGPGTGTSWRFVVEACPHLIVPDMPVTEGKPNQTMFYASAYSLPSSNSLYAFLLQPLTDKLDGNATAVDIKAKSFTSSVCLNGCTGKSVIWFTVPRAGQYRLVVEMYDPSGSYLLASEQANTTITVDELEVFEDQSWGSSAEELNMSTLHRDEPAFIDALFSIPKGDDSFSETALNSVFNTLETIVYSPATNALQNTHFVQACTRLLELDLFTSTGYMQRTLDIVEAALANSIYTGSPGFHIREALTEFYKAATRKLYKTSQTSRAGTEKLGEMAAKTRRSAATTIPLVLSAGRACGVIDTERVELNGMFEESNGVARKQEPKYDDYRIGVSCFPGQVESLPPEPAVVRSCGRSKQDARKHDGNIYVLTSVEQNDVLKKSAESDMFSGPQVEVSLFQQTEVNGRIKLVRVNGSSSECYETRVSAYVPTIMSEQFMSVENQQVTCMDAGSISDASQISSHVSERRKEAVMAREFELDASTGRVRAVVESELPVSLLLEVNGTKLEDCIRLKAGGIISGENGASQIVFWFMLVGILGCSAIAVIVLMWRWRVVHSEVGWGEEEAVGPYGAAGDVGVGSSSDETVDLNLNLPLRFGARGETGSIGFLENDRESSGASLLTATATYSSSGST